MAADDDRIYLADGDIEPVLVTVTLHKEAARACYISKRRYDAEPVTGDGCQYVLICIDDIETDTHMITCLFV